MGHSPLASTDGLREVRSQVYCPRWNSQSSCYRKAKSRTVRMGEDKVAFGFWGAAAPALDKQTRQKGALLGFCYL